MGPLTLLPLLGFALSIGRLGHVPPANSFFLAVSSTIVALYIGALSGALWWTALSVHVVGVALLGLEALRLARERQISIPVPFAVLFVLCCWFWLVHGEDQYFAFDEFAHWGVFVRDMVALDGLWTGDSNSLHPRYPPAAPLWQYLFNAFLAPSEGKTYLAHFVLLLAPLLMLWNGIRWSQPLWILAIFALSVLAVANFGLGVSMIYVDPMIGVWYFGVLLVAFADDNLASRRAALYAAPLTVLALLKDVGLPFAISGSLIAAVLIFYRTFAAAHDARVAFKRFAGALAALLVPMLLCVQLWSWNRDSVGAAADSYSLYNVAIGLPSHSGKEAADRDAEIDRRLTEVFFEQPLGNSPVSWTRNEFTYDLRSLSADSNRLTTFTLLIAFILWWAGIARLVLVNGQRQQWLIVAGGVLVTAVVYIASLHLSYRFTFGERALELPSYVRYVNVVAISMLLLSFCPLLPGFRIVDVDRVWRLRALRASRGTLAFGAALLALYVTERPYLQPLLQPNPKIVLRPYLEEVVAQIRGHAGKSRLWIYYVDDSEQGDFSRIVRYLLSPTPSVIEQSEHFLHDSNDTASIAAAWGEFEYVWIASPLTPAAAARFASFSAAGATAGFFRVHRLPDGGVTLEPLG